MQRRTHWGLPSRSPPSHVTTHQLGHVQWGNGWVLQWARHCHQQMPAMDHLWQWSAAEAYHQAFRAGRNSALCSLAAWPTWTMPQGLKSLLSRRQHRQRFECAHQPGVHRSYRGHVKFLLTSLCPHIDMQRWTLSDRACPLTRSRWEK